MDSKDLKKVIKQLVKESLTEIFAEMKLETIVETVLDKKIHEVKENKNNKVLEENYDISESRQNTNSNELKEIVKKRLAIDENEGKNIYGNIDLERNPIVKGQDTNPELVSKEQLVQSGLYRDYSKFVK